MMSTFFRWSPALAGLLSLTVAGHDAVAQGRTESGVGPDGSTWHAQSRIVGVNSTGLLSAGGDPRYVAPLSTYSGSVALIMDYGGGNTFICSGTLLADRRSILTAAHCVSDGAGTPAPLSTTVWFPGGSDPDEAVPGGPNSIARSVTDYFVHPEYTGFVIDHNDVAVLRLNEPAPIAARSYDLFSTNNLRGVDYEVVGYGGRSTIGGNFGANTGTGRMRRGNNMFDFRVGDDMWQGETYGIFGPQSRTEFSYLADFDNGLAANDAACRFGQASNFSGILTAEQRASLCDLGLGLDEVSVAGGDSGGGLFVDGRIAAITSYGITFGLSFGDIRSGLNSSFGEMNGFVPTYIHEQFIFGNMVAVPEPGSLALLGLGLVGLAAVRRRRA